MADNDIDVTTAGQDAAPVASSPTENNEPETVGSAVFDAMKEDYLPESKEEEQTEESEDKPEEPEQPEAKDDKEEESTDESTEESEAEEPTKGKDANSRIRGLVSEKRELQERIAKLEAERNQPHSAEDYVEAGYSEAQAEVAALKEQLQVDKENTRIATLNANMHEDSVNAEHDYPVFNEKSPEYDPEFTEAVANSYRRYANLQLDPSGQYIVKADIPLYDFYKQAAQYRETGLTHGRKQGAADSAKEYASAEPTPAVKPQTPQSQDKELDLLMAGLKKGL